MQIGSRGDGKLTHLVVLNLEDDWLAIARRYRILGDGNNALWGRALLLRRLLRLQESDIAAHLRLQVLVLVNDGHLHRYRCLGTVRRGDDLAQHSLIRMVRNGLHRNLRWLARL